MAISEIVLPAQNQSVEKTQKKKISGMKERGAREQTFLVVLVYGIFKVSSAECQRPRGSREGYS
jgi:hypothetical protein